MGTLDKVEDALHWQFRIDTGISVTNYKGSKKLQLDGVFTIEFCTLICLIVVAFVD